MSASREKKQRQSSAAGGLTEKQRREQAEAQKARSRAVLYGVIGVIVAVLVILLLVWNTGIFDRNKVAATINGKDYSITEVGYYYYPIANMYEQYAQFGLTSDEATMRQDALDSLHQTVALCEAAAAEGRYNARFFAAPASEFANHVRRFPAEWILPNYQGVTEEALAYFRPLIEGEPKLVMEGGLPVTLPAFNRR